MQSALQTQAATTSNATLQLPAGFAVSDFALLAQGGELLLGDGVVVEGEDRAFGAIANVGSSTGGQINVGSRAEVAEIRATTGVVLRNYAIAHGSVETTQTIQMQAGAVIEGSSVQQATSASSTFAWAPAAPSSSASPFTVANDQTTALPPGDYGAVIVRARGRLRLSPGNYRLSSLNIEPTATLELQNGAGQIVIQIQTSLVSAGSLIEEDPASANVLFAVQGTQDVRVDGPFRGTILAPAAKIVLATSAQGHVGAFIGRSVQVGPWTRIKHRPFGRFDCLANQSCRKSVCSDAGACDVTLSSTADSVPLRSAITASGQLVIENSARVTGSPTLVPPRLVNAGAGRTYVGRSSVVGSVESIAGVTADLNALIQGYTATSSTITKNLGASIIGEARANDALTLGTIRWTTKLVPSAQDLIVNDARPLAPGAYRRLLLRSGANLALTSGRYDVDSLEIESGARLNAEGTQTTVNVRTRLRLDGSVTSRESAGQLGLLLKYFGEDSVSIRAPFAGALVSASRNARLSVAASQFKGSLTAHDVFLRPGTIFDYRPIFTRDLGATPLSGVGIVGEQPSPESSQAEPVEVIADNPFFQGSFDTLGRVTGTAEGEYSHNYEWDYTRDAQFDIRAFSAESSASPISHGWGGLPVNTEAPPLQAAWHFRGGSFIPGNIYAIDAYHTSFDSLFHLTTQNATRLWAKLSSDVTVIPVVVVAWYRSDLGGDGGAVGRETASRYVKELKAVLDFRTPATNVRTNFEYFSHDGVDPTQLISGKQVPPDDIWSQCGIQFRVVGTFVFPRTGAAECGNQSRVYAQDHEARIRAERPDLADLWFGTAGLDPYFLEVGQATGCQWYGNTAVSAQAAQLNTIDWGSTQNAVTVAHEFGHILLGSGHRGSSGEGNLMAGGAGNSDRLLTGDQCETARTAARLFRRRFRDYAIALGEAEVVATPIPLDAPWLRAPIREVPPSVCCQIDGEYSRVIKPFCPMVGTPTDAANCRVCCASSDPAYRDDEGAFSIARVDECAPDRVLDGADCDFICCDRGGERGVRQTRYECLASNPARGYVAGVVATGDEAEELCPTSVPK